MFPEIQAFFFGLKKMESVPPSSIGPTVAWPLKNDHQPPVFSKRVLL
jgi:hypothetical protein